MLGIISIDEVLLNATTFEQIDLLPIRECVGQSRNSSIRVYLKKPGFLLGVFGDINLVYLVGETKFLQSDGDLDSIRSLGCVEMNV